MPLLPIRRRDGDHAGSPPFDELLGTSAAAMTDAGWQRVSEVFGSAAADPDRFGTDCRFGSSYCLPTRTSRRPNPPTPREVEHD